MTSWVGKVVKNSQFTPYDHQTSHLWMNVWFFYLELSFHDLKLPPPPPAPEFTLCTENLENYFTFQIWSFKITNLPSPPWTQRQTLPRPRDRHPLDPKADSPCLPGVSARGVCLPRGCMPMGVFAQECLTGGMCTGGCTPHWIQRQTPSLQTDVKTLPFCNFVCGRFKQARWNVRKFR